MRKTAKFVLGLAAASSLSVAARAQELALPNSLERPDGTLVASAQQWQAEQRAHLLELFQQHVYGKPSVGRPAGMSFAVVEESPQAMDGAATLKRVEIALPNADGSASMTLRLTLFVPNAVSGPVATFLLINNRGESNTDPTRVIRTEFWPAEQAIAEGFGIAAFHIGDLDPDEPSFDNGVHQVFDDGVRTQNSWGALSAWAWGASRALDYLETDPLIDARRVAVVGHSRGGKAALVAGASDERFALTISNDSGEGGASLARRNLGESITDLNTTFPHWFALQYREYNGAPELLPVDQHALIALLAPRGAYVASASEDAWADPEGEFLSAVHAAPVYELFGLSGLGREPFPAIGEHIHGQQVGYHLRQGIHDLTLFDWQLYMDFFRTVQVRDAEPEPEPRGGAGGTAGIGGAGGAREPVPMGAGGTGASPEGGAANAAAAGTLAVAGAEPAAPAGLPLASSGNESGGCGCRLGVVHQPLRAAAGSLLALGVLAWLTRRRKAAVLR